MYEEIFFCVYFHKVFFFLHEVSKNYFFSHHCRFSQNAFIISSCHVFEKQRHHKLNGTKCWCCILKLTHAARVLFREGHLTSSEEQQTGVHVFRAGRLSRCFWGGSGRRPDRPRGENARRVNGKQFVLAAKTQLSGSGPVLSVIEPDLILQTFSHQWGMMCEKGLLF